MCVTELKTDTKKEIKYTFYTKDLKHFIQMLLSLSNKGEYFLHKNDSKLTIKFLGNLDKVQEELYEWLKTRHDLRKEYGELYKK